MKLNKITIDISDTSDDSASLHITFDPVLSAEDMDNLEPSPSMALFNAIMDTVETTFGAGEDLETEYVH